MFYIFRTKRVILFLFLLTITELSVSQTRTFSFKNKASQEGLMITNQDSSCLQLRNAIKSMMLDSVSDNGYTGEQIATSGIFLPNEEGMPNVPIISRYVAIPNGATASIDLTIFNSQIIQNVDLLAAPPILLETDTVPITYEKDSSVYFTNALYPAQVAFVSDTFNIRGVNTVVVSISPYQYNPVTKELIVHHDLTINLSFEGGDGRIGDLRLRSPYWDPILKQNYVNYDQLPVVDYETRMDNWINTNAEGCEYLIVIPNDESFRTFANQLKNYRTRQGILTDVKSLYEMSCSNAQDLKAYFHNAYNNWDIPPVAVCLLGDHDENTSLGIPGELLQFRNDGPPNDPPAMPQHISDNRYADPTGDGLPDMVFSRLVAADADEAQMMVSKQLEYEFLSPNMNVDYYDHPITSTCWQTNRWFQICAETIGGYLVQMGKHPIRINTVNSFYGLPGSEWSSYSNTDIIVDYFGPTGLGYIPINPISLGGWSGGTDVAILNAINSGSMLLFHRDHGDIDSWIEPHFDISSFLGMENSGNLTFVISVDCLTGMFNDADGNCLIEEFLRHKTWENNNGGAVGGIAPTNKSYSFVNDVYAWGLFDFFSPDFLPDMGQYGEHEGNWLPAFGNVAAKYFLSENNWSGYSNYKQITYDIYTSHCDAFLRLFSVVPQNMIVHHPDVIDMGQGRCHVTAPEGAVIALTVNNSILKVATATGNTQVLVFEPQDPNTVIDLVVTKQDYLRYEAQITNEVAYINGNTNITIPQCDNYEYTLEIQQPNLYTYVWHCSSNLRLASSTGNTALVRPVGLGSGTVSVDVYYNGQLYAQYDKDISITTNYHLVSSSSLNIYLNTTWSSDNTLLAFDAIIEPGATLTITGTVYCANSASIIVKPDGCLKIIGGHLQGICEDEQWQGIQVWGNTDKHQLIENGQYWQGRVEMSNAATIENAIIGIDVWKRGDLTCTGGIVKAVDSRFINNAKAVTFHPYENQYEHPQQPGTTVVKDNVSYFRNCEFKIDENYLGPEVFSSHADLIGVRGISFLGCDFGIQNGDFCDSNTIGLYAYDAGFKLKGTRTRIQNSGYVYDNTVFSGFDKAVVSLNDGASGLRPVFIQNTDFAGNRHGVSLVNNSFCTIIKSGFEVGKGLSGCSTGIFAECTPNFVIELDTFAISQACPDENYGIVVKNSRSQNLIYKNVFNGLYCANLSIGRNNTYVIPKTASSPKTNILGLEYRCNENADNYCDFYVVGGDSYYRLGIQTNQGTVNEPANNTFSAGNAFNFMNHGNNGINYYLNQNLTNGTPTNILGVTLEPTTDTCNCPEHYGFGGISYNDTLTPLLSDTLKLLRELQYYNAHSAFNSIKTLYDGRIDGGSTEDEINDILSASPSDMWALRAQLLGHSPYLSSEVLMVVAENSNVFPQSVLFEILASNPDELKSDSLIRFLQDLDNPLPDYMMALLQQIANGTTARTAMESQMANYSQVYRQAAGDIIRSMLNDTVCDKDALIGWLGNMNDLESDRAIIGMYLADGDYNSALALANMLPSLYSLSDDDLSEHNDYISLLNLYHSLAYENRSIWQMDSGEKALVEYLAEYSLGTPQAMARSIMTEVYGRDYFACPSGLDFGQNGDRSININASVQVLNKVMGLLVEISPNPIQTWASVHYSLPSGEAKAQLILANAVGATVAQFSLSGNEGNMLLDLRDLSSGIYTYTITCERLSQTGKLVITK